MSSNRREQLTALLRERIVILDGGMGTMIQRLALSEAQYRGSQYADWPSDLKGNNDLLSITQPEMIEQLHRDYLNAGADIITSRKIGQDSKDKRISTIHHAYCVGSGGHGVLKAGAAFS